MTRVFDKFGRTPLMALLAAAIPVLIFAVLVVWWVDRVERRAAEETLATAVQNGRDAADRELIRHIARLQTMAALLAQGPITSERANLIAGATMAGEPHWVNVRITDRDKVLFSAAESGPPKSSTIADPNGVAEVFRTGQPAISPTQVSLTSPDKWIVRVRVPIFGPEGSVSHTLAATVHVWSFVEALKSIRLPQGDWRLVLIDQDGKLVARSAATTPSDRYLGQQANPSLWRGIQNSDGLFTFRTLDDKDLTALKLRSVIAPWTVVAAAPPGELLAHRTTAISIAVGGGLLALAATLLLARQVAHAQRLQQQVERDRAAAAANRALTRSEERYRVIFDQAAVGIEQLDLTGRIIEVNRRAAEILGYDRDELIGRNVVKLTHPDDRDKERRLLDSLLAGNVDHYACEKRYLRRDGSAVWVRVTSSLLRSLEGSRRISIIEDISDRKQAEAETVAARAEAEQANEAKSRFLAAASHDLRQPVQSLALFSEVLKSRITDSDALHVAQIMSQSVDSLGQLLNSLLDVSRLESGTIHPNPTTLPLQPIMERLAQEYGPRAAAKNLRLRAVSTKAVTHSDPVLLERMLRNLIENALRYTPQGGILLGPRRRHGRLRLAVVDTGIGIPPERHHQIFEEFVQAGSTKAHASGMGLGLAVVRRIGKLLGHSVDMCSVEGRGSSFWIEVPIVTHHAQHRSGLIVVVDDEAEIRHGFRNLLESWGFDVVTGESADEAVAGLRKEMAPPVAILADYRLRGGHNGIEAITAIRECSNRHIPAAIITGDTTSDRLHEAHRRGYPVLHKPVAPSELRSTLDMLVGKRSKSVI